MSSESLDLDRLCLQIASLDKGRRFSRLSADELVSAWIGSVKFIHHRVTTTEQAFFVPNFGYFKWKRKTGFEFIAAQSWLRYGEFSQFVQKKIPDSKNIDLINYSQIAADIQKPRESIELTFKEITLRIMQLVLQDVSVSISLNCYEMGALHIHTKPLQFKLKRNAAILVLPTVIKQETVVEENEIKAIARDCGLTVSKMLDIKLPDATTTTAVRFMIPEVSDSTENRPKSVDSDVSDLTVEGSDEWPRFVIRSRNIRKLNLFIKVTTTHKHQHSGDRLWMNHACPIYSRNQSMQNTASHEQDSVIAQDKLILQRAITDSENLTLEKITLFAENKRHANEIAQYNKDMMDLKAHYKTELPPIGDLFFKRTNGIDKVAAEAVYKQELANQIEAQNVMQKEAEIQSMYQDRIQSQAFQQRYQKEVESKMRKEYKQQQSQKNYLAYQVQLKKEAQIQPTVIPLANLFARDESPCITQKHQLESDCFTNQRQMVDLRGESRMHDKMVEDSNYLRQLNYSQMVEDVEAAKKLRFETRKYLENYWKEQVDIHTKMGTNHYD